MLPDVREEMSQRELCMTAMTIWQIGGTRRVCKETFLEIPHHENFLQMDEGEDTYIQCSGTIVVNNVEFVIEPLVLVFDLSEPLSKEINDLRAFPTTVVIRDAKYCLAGITVFIEKRVTMLVIFSIKRQIPLICMTDFVQVASVKLKI